MQPVETLTTGFLLIWWSVLFSEWGPWRGSSTKNGSPLNHENYQHHRNEHSHHWSLLLQLSPHYSVLNQQWQKTSSSFCHVGQNLVKLGPAGFLGVFLLWFGSSWHETLWQPPCCRRYVSAHRSPTGRWLRKHVQEWDGLWGVGGVVMRRGWCLAAERHHTRNLTCVWSSQPNLELATTWLARSVLHTDTTGECVRAHSHTFCLHLNTVRKLAALETKAQLKCSQMLHRRLLVTRANSLIQRKAQRDPTVWLKKWSTQWHRSHNKQDARHQLL